jgi:putative ABC transport system permease protein
VYYGHAITAIYASNFRNPHFQYRMLPWIALSAVAIALAAAAAAVFGALVRVVRLPPAEAMRPPAPPSYAPTLAERIGLGRLYSPGVRMVVRDMERRPLRALLTVLGIASAIAVTITGTWWRDSLDYLLDVELRMRERQDVSVVLNAPVSTTALYDLQRLPGVLRAEGDRSAPARLSNRQRTYRTTISALTADSQMHPLLDEHLRPTPLPAGGIVLNRRLADRLDLRLGDPVHVEVLQGAHAHLTLTVAAFSHELMQMPAYLERAALNRLLGEGDALSGARLQIDAAQRDALLRQLKATPRVAAVAELTTAIRHVRANAARNILFFSTVLTALAVAITFGVVYNNARVALAERAWDLASLRVLGFTRAEVSGLLLGELGAQLLLALPVGCLLGAGLSWVILQLSTSDTMQLPFVIAPRTYAFACLAVLLAGVASALIVRRRIDRLDLVAVLKTRD